MFNFIKCFILPQFPNICPRGLVLFCFPFSFERREVKTGESCTVMAWNMNHFDFCLLIIHYWVWKKYDKISDFFLSVCNLVKSETALHYVPDLKFYLSGNVLGRSSDWKKYVSKQILSMDWDNRIIDYLKLGETHRDHWVQLQDTIVHILIFLNKEK